MHYESRNPGGEKKKRSGNSVISMMINMIEITSHIRQLSPSFFFFFFLRRCGELKGSEGSDRRGEGRGGGDGRGKKGHIA